MDHCQQLLITLGNLWNAYQNAERLQEGLMREEILAGIKAAMEKIQKEYKASCG